MFGTGFRGFIVREADEGAGSAGGGGDLPQEIIDRFGGEGGGTSPSAEVGDAPDEQGTTEDFAEDDGDLDGGNDDDGADGDWDGEDHVEELVADYLKSNDIPDDAKPFVEEALRAAVESSPVVEEYDAYAPTGVFDYQPEAIGVMVEMMEVLEGERGDEARLGVLKEIARETGMKLVPADADAGEDADPEKGRAPSSSSPDLPDDVRSALKYIEDFKAEREEAQQRADQERQQQQQRAQVEEYTRTSIERIQGQIKRDLSQAELDHVMGQAMLAAERGEKDPIAAAWKQIRKQRTERDRERLRARRGEPETPDLRPSSNRPRRSGTVESDRERAERWYRENVATT